MIQTYYGNAITQHMIAISHYVSQINEVKHPYHDGCAARKGIEF